MEAGMQISITILYLYYAFYLAEYKNVSLGANIGNKHILLFSINILPPWGRNANCHYGSVFMLIILIWQNIKNAPSGAKYW